MSVMCCGVCGEALMSVMRCGVCEEAVMSVLLAMKHPRNDDPIIAPNIRIRLYEQLTTGENNQN
jgi:hypothetical protein